MPIHYRSFIAAKLSVAAVALASTAQSTAAVASPTNLRPEAAIALVRPFYEAVTAPTPQAVRRSAESVTTPDWRNCSDEDVCETREQAIARWGGLRRLIPDVRLQVREVLVSGSKIVVRGELTGTPVAPIQGIPPAGRSFRIMTLDVHDVVDGRIAHTYHMENWSRGIEQLRGSAK